MVGSKGSGKTNTASELIDTLVSLGYDVFTNIHFFKKDNIKIARQKGKLADVNGHHYKDELSEHIHMITSLSQLILEILKCKNPRKIFILDEAGIHADSGSVTSRSTKTIKLLNRIIRHFDCCFVILTQTEGSVPPDLREKDVDYRFQMTKKFGKYYLIIGKKKEMHDEETGKRYVDFPRVKKFVMPLSRLPYDSKFPSGFDVDLDLKELLNRLSEVGDSVEIMDKGKGEAVVRQIIQEKKEGKKKKISKKDLIRSEFENDTEFSLRELSKKYNTSYQNVCNIHADFLRENE